MSYSDADRTVRVLMSINLNPLMDGIMVLTVARSMRHCLREVDPTHVRPYEVLVLADLGANLEGLQPDTRTARFHPRVTATTVAFVSYWRGEVLVE